MENISIETPRLLLKSVTAELVHELFRTKSKDEIITFLGTDEKGYERYLGMHENGMESFRLSMFYFLLVHKESQLPIGECGFHTWNTFHRRAEIFYLLHSDDFKKQGLMSEALQAVLHFGFTSLQLHRVEALVDPQNTPSIKLLQKNGFSLEGVMREDYNVNGVNEDSTCYSLLKWEWEQHIHKSQSTS